MTDVHIVLQGKGGVGKTLVAWLLLQHAKKTFGSALGIDLDSVNASLSEFAALPVEKMDIQSIDSSSIDQRKFDDVVERVATAKCPVVLDIGASTYLPLVSYMHECGLPDALKERGVSLSLHVPMVGGNNMGDCLAGLKMIYDKFSTAEIYTWLNEFFGPVVASQDGQTVSYEDTPAAQEMTKLAGIIQLAQQKELSRADLAQLLSNNHTFEEAAKSKAYTFMSKRRLQLLEKNFFAAIATALRTGTIEDPKEG